MDTTKSPCATCKYQTPGVETCPRGAAPALAAQLGKCAKREPDRKTAEEAAAAIIKHYGRRLDILAY